MDEEIKDELKELSKQFENMGSTLAKTTKSYYDNLVKEGFSKEEAMRIICRCEKE